MDNREKMVRMLMDIEEGRISNMVFGFVRGAYKESRRRKRSGKYVQPELSCKMEIIRLLLGINNERFIKAIYISVHDYVDEKGGAA